MKKTLLMTIVGLTLVSQFAFAKNDTITYKTEMGSVLELQAATDNSLSGYFTSAVASKECQQVIGVKKPVLGYVSKNAITFSVNYSECDAVVTFVGYLGKDGKSIDTTSIIVRDPSSTIPVFPANVASIMLCSIECRYKAFNDKQSQIFSNTGYRKSYLQNY